MKYRSKVFCLDLLGFYKICSCSNIIYTCAVLLLINVRLLSLQDGYVRVRLVDIGQSFQLCVMIFATTDEATRVSLHMCSVYCSIGC